MAFYVPTGEPGHYESTEHTQGPWGADLQHAGPPSALLASAIEATPSSVEGQPQVARVTTEILGAVPIRPVQVRAEVVRPGRSVELVEAELTADGRVVLRARAWRVVRRDVTLPEDLPPRPAAPALPDPADEWRITDPRWSAGYLKALEWRFAEGHFAERGPASVWARMRMPLVQGAEPSGLQRLLVLADSGNGISRWLRTSEWFFINTDLTVHLHHEPQGEWICLAAETTLGEHGMGLAASRLYDTFGEVGRGAQALMIAPR